MNERSGLDHAGAPRRARAGHGWRVASRAGRGPAAAVPAASPHAVSLLAASRSSPLLLAVALLSAPAIASAHHSGLYDENNVVSIEGTIVDVHWINPHVVITLETVVHEGADAARGGADNERGSEPERWRVEGTSANALERWGVERERFAVGDELRTRGPASRLRPTEMIGAVVELAAGERIVLWPNVAERLGLADTRVDGLFPPPSNAAAESVERSAAPARGLFKVWTPRGGTAARTPEALSLTEPAREAARDYDPQADDPALKCEPPGMPRMLDTPYPVAFAEQDDRIVMRYEEWDGERTIYMRPGSGPPAQEHSSKGVSFGRWEGETLAIFTLYIDYPYFDRFGTPQTEAVTVLERYTPSTDGTRLDWQLTVTDEATFTEPVVQRGYMTYEPGETIRPYDCTLPASPSP